MTYEEVLSRFGVPASLSDRNEIRRLLADEVELGRREEDREEMLRILCVLLFSLGVVEDALLIWDAKQSNFDAGCGLDIQFLCGAGLQATKDFLAITSAPTAPAALAYLNKCERGGDFEEFSPQEWLSHYRRYYGLES
jgi:hypothetical protein